MAFLTHRILLLIIALLLLGALGTYLLYPRPDLAARDAAVTASEDELRALIHPTLRYTSEPPAEDDNAYPLWERAFALAKQIDAGPWEELFYDWSESLLDVEQQRHRLPEGEQRQAMRRWLDSYEPVFDLLAEALDRPEAYIPAEAADAPSDTPWGWELRGIRRALHVAVLEMHLAVLDGDPARAIERGALVLATVEKMLDAHGFAIDNMVAAATGMAVVPMLVELAAHPDLDDEQRRHLLGLFDPAASSTTAVKRSVRREFDTVNIPGLLWMADGVVEGDFHAPIPGEVAFESFEEIEEKVEAASAMYQRMWDRGDSVLDVRATVRQLSQLLSEFFDLLATPGSGREVGAWQEEKTDAAVRIYQALEEAIERSRLPRPRDKRDNIIGRQTAYLQAASFAKASTTMLRFDALRRQAHVGVAALIYEKEHGHLPETLDHLVEAGLIDEVPRDPFDGRPLRYAAEHRLLWSIGREDPWRPLRDDADEQFLRAHYTSRRAGLLLPSLDAD